jgi:hypothetical protein
VALTKNRSKGYMAENCPRNHFSFFFFFFFVKVFVLINDKEIEETLL